MLVCGIDEVGRGPLAGPVVAAAAVFESGYYNARIKDSKQLSKKMRDILVAEIKRDAVAWSVVAVGPRRIERLNIREATRLAMELALSKVSADLVLIDGNMGISTGIPQRTVIAGDTLHVEISAASIIAKVYRDNLMAVLDRRYPGYEFEQHAGYPTSKHLSCLKKLGPSPVHRRTFKGVRELVNN